MMVWVKCKHRHAFEFMRLVFRVENERIWANFHFAASSRVNECSNSSIGYSITGTIGFNSNVMMHYCTAAAGFLAVVITVNLMSLDYYACNILLAQYTTTSSTQNI